MRHCDKCNVDVESALKNCPLCGAYLQNDDGEKTKNIYAYREVSDRARSRRLVLKLLLFASLIAGVVCLIVDIVSNGKLLWAMHLVVALVGFWLAIGWPIFGHVPIRKQLVTDMVVAVLLVFYTLAFDDIHDKSWGFQLGMPIVLMSTMGLYVLMMIIDNKRWRQYAMTATPIAFFSIIMIFVSLGVFKSPSWAWYVTTGIAVIMWISFFIFGKRGYIQELKMKLHF